MKKIIFLLFLIFFWLQYSFWFGKNGVCDFFRIRNNIKVKRINACRIELKFRNNRLLSDICDLIENQKEAIEERARNELGMIKFDESFFYLVILDKEDVSE